MAWWMNTFPDLGSAVATRASAPSTSQATSPCAAKQICARRLKTVACACSSSCICTKARTTKRLIWTARELLSTVAAINAPCSVKAQGKEANGRLRDVIAICDDIGTSISSSATSDLDIANCDIKRAYSSRVSWNRKSGGKRSVFRLIASLKRKVGTP